MNWIETLGPSRPQSIAGRRFRARVTPDELRAIFDSLESDEACAGHKTSLDLPTLCKCLYAAAKMESEGARECRESAEFHALYRELFSFFEAYLTEFPCLRRSPGDNEVLLYCLGILVDLTKFVLRTIDESTPPERTRDAVFLVRTLCRVLDRDLPFHQQHEHCALPQGLLDGPRRYVSHRYMDGDADICGNRMKRKRSITAGDRNTDCRCPECGTAEPHLWVKCLVEYFGRCCPGNGDERRGFDVLKTLLPILHRLPIDLTEVVLHFFAKSTEYLRHDLRSNLIMPCMEFLKGLVQRCERELDQKSVEVFVVILKHLRSLLKFLLPAEIAQALMKDLQNPIQDMLVGVVKMECKSGVRPSEVPPATSAFFNEKVTQSSWTAEAWFFWSVISSGIAWVRSAIWVMIPGEPDDLGDFNGRPCLREP